MVLAASTVGIIFAAVIIVILIIAGLMGKLTSGDRGAGPMQ
ncbi:MAG: hypothetical protein Q7T55_24000 [Solirubrobacteraceae bacterium]|nr:hypothetical protein [Solirubrobacteraceae bacterium]